MKINYNLSALIANNSLGKAENNLQSSLAKLSSGYRINEAKDDTTGMAISKKMQEQINALDKADSNALDAVSLLQTADGAITEIQSMLQRMRELNVKAANGTSTTEDKQAIQEEVDQLTEEIDRLSKDTEFNGIPILDGSLQEKGFTSQPDNVTVDYYTSQVSTQNYQLSVTSLASQGVAITSDLGSLTSPISSSMAGTVTINGYEVDIEEGDTADEVYEKLREAGSYADVNVYAISTSATPTLTQSTLESAGYTSTTFANNNTTALLFVSEDYGTDAHVSVSCDNTSLAAALGITTSSSYDSATGSMTDYGTDTALTLGTGFDATATYRADGDKIYITDQSSFEVDLTVSPLTTTGTVDLEITDMGDMSIQVGGHEGQNISISIADCGSEALGIDNLNMIGTESINKSLNAIDNALDRVTEIRASIGAYENRLDSTITSIDQTIENMTEAYSRIMDTDMASEMTEYTQQNVINQAATSMLAQANDLPQTVLQLLS